MGVKGLKTFQNVFLPSPGCTGSMAAIVIICMDVKKDIRHFKHNSIFFRRYAATEQVSIESQKEYIFYLLTLRKILTNLRGS